MSMDGFECELRIQEVKMGFGRAGSEDYYRNHTIECSGTVLVANISSLKLPGTAADFHNSKVACNLFFGKEHYNHLREDATSEQEARAHSAGWMECYHSESPWGFLIGVDLPHQDFDQLVQLKDEPFIAEPVFYRRKGGIYTEPNGDRKSTVLYIQRVHFSIRRELQ